MQIFEFEFFAKDYYYTLMSSYERDRYSAES